MYRKNSNQVDELLRKLQQSERDKQQLINSIQELNECYSSKIQVLQNTIDAYEDRIQQLLLLRKNEIDQQLSCSTKFQEENKKLLGIIDQLYATFDQEKYKLEEVIKMKDEQLAKVTQQRDELISKTQGTEQRLDQLVRQHTKQIQQLKKQLILLKDEVSDNAQQPHNKQQVIAQSQLFEQFQPKQTSQQMGMPLKQIVVFNISNKEQKNEETRIKQISNRNLNPSIEEGMTQNN